MPSRNAIIQRSITLSTAACFVTLGFAAIAASASDPWKDKDADAWNQKDVQKILNDSPWSKQLQFGIGADGTISQNITNMGSAAGNETTGSASSGTRIGAGPGAPNNGPSGGSSEVTPMAKFRISWHSSVTIRQALVREKELSGSPPDQARKDLAAKYDAYQISISGADLRAFVKEGVESFKMRSYLTTKSTKQKIVPSNVTIQTRQDGNPVAILFDFPKTTATGEATIASAEKSVEFAAKVGNLPLKITFDISKMSAKDGRDL